MTMKKSYLLLLLVLTFFGMSSCLKNDPQGWEYGNAAFGFDLMSADGKSLINPNSKQGEEWLGKIIIEYKGEKYRYEGQLVRTMRAIAERYKSFNVVMENKRYYLRFAEFQPVYKEKQSIKLTLPNGQVKEIQFVHYAEAGKLISKVWYDGKEMAGDRIVKIVTDPYLKEGEKEIPLPMYVYVASRFVIKAPNLPKEYEKMQIQYKEKVYRLGEKPQKDGGKLFFDKEIGKLIPLVFEDCIYFKFGPFYPENSVTKGQFKIEKGSNKIAVEFSCYYDKDGKFFYEAYPLLYDGPQPRKLYFKNGPLVILPL